jgi:hypothetical protein
MRTIFATLILATIIFSACNKDDNVGNNPFRNDIGYLLKEVIGGKDTTHFQYDNNNRLTKLLYSNGTFNYRGIFESFQYNSKGEIVSTKYTYTGSTSHSVIINFSYRNDTIIKTNFREPYNGFGDVSKFILSNDRIVEAQLGGIANGTILSSGHWDTLHYFYQDDNLIKCSFPFLTSTYQPIDTFLYNKNFYNPHLLLGKHKWSLLQEFGRGLAFAESKNIPSTITISNYSFAAGTLMSSGFFSYKMIAVEGSQENPLLPKSVKYLADDGAEITTRYFYQRQK